MIHSQFAVHVHVQVKWDIELNYEYTHRERARDILTHNQTHFLDRSARFAISYQIRSHHIMFNVFHVVLCYLQLLVFILFVQFRMLILDLQQVARKKISLLFYFCTIIHLVGHSLITTEQLGDRASLLFRVYKFGCTRQLQLKIAACQLQVLIKAASYLSLKQQLICAIHRRADSGRQLF